MRVLTSSILLAVALAGSASTRAQPPGPDGARPRPRGDGEAGEGRPPEGFVPRRPFISPMGEQFRGTAELDGAGVWFAGADANKDGILTETEMVADADRFFALLDTDGDGRLNGTEISRYETEIAPLVQGRGFGGGEGGGRRGGGRRGGHGGGHRGGGGGMGGGMGGNMDEGMGELAAGGSEGGSAPAKPDYDDQRQGAARFSYLNIPEPVASADTNLNFIVTQQEFRDTARSRFGLLDTNHDGKITQAELPPLPGFSRRR